MAEVRKDDFLAHYRYQAVDTARLRQSSSAHASTLAAADANNNGEIAIEPGSDELSMLFDRIAALDPNHTATSFNTERGSAGAAFNLITAHMRQKTGAGEESLGTRTLAQVPSLAAIFEGRPGAKLRRVDGRATLGTGPVQDALNEIASFQEARRGAGFRSPLRVDYGQYRGYFGATTDAVVRAFQGGAQLGVDGIVGKNTLLALDRMLAEARGTPRPPALSSTRFQTALFQRILEGTATLAQGSRDKAAIETLQLSLYSLGFDIGTAWVDRDFGRSTKAGLSAFQASVPLPETGVLDKDTLLALDRKVTEQINTLRASSVAMGSKHTAYKLVIALEPNGTQRIYVLNRGNEQPVARYLTSPGRRGHETMGTQFTIQRTLPRSTWNPPNSEWARNLSPVGPGIDNPMGILKLDLGAYVQYIHGMPKSEERYLGQPASHGCLRMSPTNILHLHENYAETGTDVKITRDTAECRRLDNLATTAGIADQPLSAGREWIAGYVSGELGEREALRNGAPVIA